MATLNENMNNSQGWVPLSESDANAIEPGHYVLDSEYIVVGGPHIGSPGRTSTRPNGRWVARAAAGSTAATHLSGATLTRYYPDAPGGEGGGTPTLAEVLAEGADADGVVVTNLGAPVADDDAATKEYVDNTAGGLSIIPDPAATWQAETALDEGDRITSPVDPRVVIEVIVAGTTGEEEPEPNREIIEFTDGTVTWRRVGIIGTAEAPIGPVFDVQADTRAEAGTLAQTTGSGDAYARNMATAEGSGAADVSSVARSSGAGGAYASREARAEGAAANAEAVTSAEAQGAGANADVSISASLTSEASGTANANATANNEGAGDANAWRSAHVWGEGDAWALTEAIAQTGSPGSALATLDAEAKTVTDNNAVSRMQAKAGEASVSLTFTADTGGVQAVFVGLPTADPTVAGALWIDTGAGRVLKVSAG